MSNKVLFMESIHYDELYIKIYLSKNGLTIFKQRIADFVIDVRDVLIPLDRVKYVNERNKTTRYPESSKSIRCTVLVTLHDLLRLYFTTFRGWASLSFSFLKFSS